jgi:hypothetical protein
MANRSRSRQQQQQADETLRNLLDEEEPELELGDDGEFPIEMGQEIDAPELLPHSDVKFLGMTAGERAFLSVMFFMNVAVMGAAMLILTKRLQF